jgi:hypothetical protein
MVDRTQSLEGETAVGDILVKIRGRTYLIPAEAIGKPLEDDGSEVLGMLEKELSALRNARESRLIGVDFAMELGESEADRNARAISARQSRQCVRQARQCTREAGTRQARQCTRQARQCTRQARQCSRPADNHQAA